VSGSCLLGGHLFRFVPAGVERVAVAKNLVEETCEHSNTHTRQHCYHRSTDTFKLNRQTDVRPLSCQHHLARSIFSAHRVLANVNSSSRSLYAIARPSICRLSSVCLSSVRLSSIVCNARAPYSGGCKFRQFFYAIWYLGHPLTSTYNFTEIVPGEPLRRGS